MENMTVRKTLFVIASVSFSVAVLISCGFNNSAAATAEISSGVMDLRGRDFLETDSVRLNGEWEFYWNQLLSPEDFKKEPGAADIRYIRVPSVWNDGSWYGEELPGYGYGTYRLTVLTDGSDQMLAVKMKEIFTSYRLWINGRLVYSCGRVGPSSDEAVPRFSSHVSSFPAEGKKIEIIMQVSNFTYKTGGFSTAMELGPASVLKTRREKSLVLHYILFGSLLIMGLYHFGLYSLRREDPSTLYFGLLCLIMITRVLVTNEMFFADLFPKASWELMIRIIVVGYYLLIPVFVTFLFSLYPRAYHRKLIRLIQAVGLAAALTVLITRQSFYVQTEIFIQGFMIIVFVYILIGLIKAAYRRMDGALLVIIGMMLFFVTVVNDLLYGQYSRIYHPVNTLTPYGLFLFIFIQSYILSARFSHAFRIANIDELTQVYNRRRFTELSEQLFSAHERSGRKLSLLFIDLDHFKSVNDNYGHDIGDLVLKTVAQIFRGAIRRSDIFGRLGGEEFALLLPDTDIDEACVIADRIRVRLSGTKIAFDDSSVSVTMSVGAASNEDEAAISLKKLSKYADQALYRAKNGGRNRVEAWSSGDKD